MTTLPPRITAGVDTHLDVHVCAALDELGTLLGVESFPITTAGYRQLIAWAGRFGTSCWSASRAPDPTVPA